jgi:hypothetical protein
MPLESCEIYQAHVLHMPAFLVSFNILPYQHFFVYYHFIWMEYHCFITGTLSS